MVAQFQETNVSGRFVLTREGYSTPDFTKVGEAYGIKCMKVTHEKQIRKLIKKINNLDNSLIVEVEISQEAQALPKMQW
jgi:thiamine pyrophosphate-dependent acetolactate synthase large subunit-like protein